MNQTEINTTPLNTFNNDDSVDIKKITQRILRNWYWFVLSILVAGGLAYVYNRYSTPVYMVNSTMLLEEDYNNSPPLSGMGQTGNVFEGLGMSNSMRNIYNQVVVLKSTPIINKTLEELNFEVSYYSVGDIKTTESYKSVPFQVIWDEDHPQIIETDFDLTILPDGKLEISAEGENTSVFNYKEGKVIRQIPVFSFTREIDAGVRLTTDEFSFTILLNENFNPKAENNYSFKFHSRSWLVEKYYTSVQVELADDYSTILNISLRDFNKQKAADFLNKLTEVYQLDNLSKKNENANRTIQFINSQLQSISDSLNISETEKEAFQSENQVLDISVQSQQLLEQMTDLDKEKVTLQTQNKYYHYLKDYIESNQEMESVMAPSAMGINDPLLNSLILQLNELFAQKSSNPNIKENSEHPTMLRFNAQIASVKNSLLENTSNIISQSDIALEDLNRRIRRYETEVRRLPATERNYVNIERKYKLNNETYTFLLQKLSEAQIAKASNIPDSQVIEEARGGTIVAPQAKRIYAIALLLALVIPAAFIFLRKFFNNKVMSQDEIEAITNIPVIGHVFHNEREFGSRTLVLDKPNSPASEPYRAIRNKLNLLTKGKDNPVIAVTSTFPKEGKSYNAINIASSFALMRKNAVILDLDLRNSKMSEEFDLKSDVGFVNYIIGKASLEDITFDTKHPRLKLIPAGPIPPNPAEMLTDDKLYELIEKLKSLYDVIVIDTPPVGFVADIFQLHDIIDANMFVVRHKYTHKEGLKTALSEVSKHQLKGVGIIVNNISRGKRNYGFSAGYGYGYGYGYSYGYSYGYGYGSDKKSKRKKLTEEE